MKTTLVRPTVLTPEVQKKVLKLLSQGNFVATACEASGLTYQTFRSWQRRWEDGDPGAQQFAQFFELVALAVPLGEAQALMTLRIGAPGWQAQAWFLERRFPKRWAKKDELIIKNQDVSKMTDEELQVIAKAKG